LGSDVDVDVDGPVDRNAGDVQLCRPSARSTTAGSCRALSGGVVGGLLPGVLEVISRAVSAAIRFGRTTGYLTLAGS
jgi:hypothetical protein